SGKCGVVPFNSEYVKLESSAPWNLYASDSVEDGYIYQVCLRCLNNFASYDFDNWLIQQFKNTVVYNITIPVDPTPKFMTPIKDQFFDEVMPGDSIMFEIPLIQAIYQTDVIISGLDLEIDGNFFVMHNINETVFGINSVNVTLRSYGLETSYLFLVIIRPKPNYNTFVFERPEVEVPVEFKHIVESGLGFNPNFTNFTRVLRREEPIEIYKQKFNQNGELTLVFSEDLFNLSFYTMLNLTYVNDNID
ncbi:MAG: hypothetical protein RL226_1735, partial [Bacteroidota bacterium]